jgi:hypothetical protein
MISKMTSCLLALSASWLSPIMTFMMWTSGRVARIALHVPVQHACAFIKNKQKIPSNPFFPCSFMRTPCPSLCYQSVLDRGPIMRISAPSLLHNQSLSGLATYRLEEKNKVFNL